MGGTLIPLMGQQPQVETPLSVLSLLNQTKLQQAALAQSRQQQQIGQQELAQQQIQTQQAQLMQQSQQRLMHELANTGGNWDKAIENLQSSGEVSPEFLQKATLERMNLLKSMQGYSEGQLTLAQNQADAIGKAALAIKDADPNDRGDVARQQLNNLRLLGIPNLPTSIPTDDSTLDGFIAHSKAALDMAKEALANKQAEQALPAQQAANALKETQNTAQLLSNANSQQDVDRIIAMQRANGVPDEVLGQFEKTPFSAEAKAQWLHAALSPQQQAGVGRQAVNLQLPNGQRVAGMKDQFGHLLTAEGGPVPPGTTLYVQPNYGAMVLPTKTATYLDANGVPTEYQWDQKTQKYDIPVGTSAAGTYGHEAAQAGVVQRAGNQLIADIQANAGSIDRSKLGTWSTWVKKYGLDTPFADPTLAQLQAEYKSFAALNPGMHGYRSAEAMKGFEDLIGGLQKNPQAAIASIQGILKTASQFNPNQNTQHSPGSKAGLPDGTTGTGSDHKKYIVKGGVWVAQ